MAYINNTFSIPSPSPAWKSFGSQNRVTSNNQIAPYSKPYTPALNNVQYTPTNPKGPSSKLDTSSLGMNAFKINTPSDAWKKSNATMGPIQPSTHPVGNAPSKGVAPLTPSIVGSQGVAPANTPAPSGIGATTTVGSTPQTGTKGLLNARGGIAKAGASKGTSTNPSTGFAGYVGQIGNAANASDAQRKLQQQLQNESMANKQIGENAADISKMYGDQIQQLYKAGAGAEAGWKSNPLSAVGSGNAAIAAQSVGSQIQGLAAGQQAALQGTGQQLTGQAQTQSGLNQALGSANTQQQLQLSGLGTAAGYAQPSPAAYGQSVFNPLTRQFEGGSTNMDPQTQANNLAQQVMAGKMTMAQAQQALSYAGAAGNNFLANAITQAGGNPLQLEAQNSVQQSNIGTSGTAITSANAQGLQQSIQQEMSLGTAATQAQDLARQVQVSLQSSGLQLTNSADMNTVVNNLQSRLGNEAYTKLNIAVNDAKAAYAQILSTAGATPTEAGSMAEQNINANMSPNQILSAIDQLNQGVKARQDAAHLQTQNYNKMLGSSNGGSNATPAIGGGGTVGGWDDPNYFN